MIETPFQREVRLQATLISDVERLLKWKELDTHFKGVMKGALAIERNRLSILKTRVVRVKIKTDKLKKYGINKGEELAADVSTFPYLKSRGAMVFVYPTDNIKLRVSLFPSEYIQL